MWRASFVATSVALGGTVDEAVTAVSSAPASVRYSFARAGTAESLEDSLPSASAARADSALHDVVTGLRSSSRATRATTLAKSVGEIVVAIDRVTLA